MIHIYIIFFRTFKLNLWKPQLRLQLQFYFFLLLFFSFIPESSLASAPSHRDRRPLADQRLTAGLLTQLRAANNRGAWSSITHPWLYLHLSQQRLPHTDTSSQKSINTCSKSPCPPPLLQLLSLCYCSDRHQPPSQLFCSHLHGGRWDHLWKLSWGREAAGWDLLAVEYSKTKIWEWAAEKRTVAQPPKKNASYFQFSSRNLQLGDNQWICC